MYEFFSSKEKGICAFNNYKEQRELMDLFNKEKIKIFLNEEKEEAIRFAETNKVFGFLLEQELLNLKYLNKLKYQQCYAVNILSKEKDFCVILNDIYYVSTKERILWQRNKKSFWAYTYYGHEDYFVEDLEQNIINYATETMQSIEDATANYFGNFKLIYHHYPWDILSATNIKQIDDKIEFRLVSDTIAKDGDELKLIMKKSNVRICDEDIISVSVRDIPRRIKNEAIVDVIRNNLWL